MSEPSETTDQQAYALKSPRAAQHLAELWVEMGKTEAFTALLAELDEMATRYRKLRFDSMMRGEPVNQREVDYERGLVAGLDRPRRILKTAYDLLDKGDAKAEERTEEEVTYW